MSDVNVWTATGRVGADPEFKDINGTPLAKFGLAVDNYAGRDKPDVTSWFTCQLWGDRTKVANFIKKGMALTVTGKIEIRKDNEGRYWTTVNLTDVKLPPKGAAGGGAAGAQDRARRSVTEPDDDLGF